MAERKRPGDDAAGDRPEDEVFDDAVADDDAEAGEPVTRGGGTAVRERTENADKPRSKEGRRGGRIGGFFREVVSELRKVIWPTRKELLTYTAVVIVFVAVMTTIVAVLDYGFGKGILASFGN
ncbi:preprotein translocase subunit SecE [Couchioplanes caeruleus]|uniref:preprotein translocase subunit SecE n=1 Tax=Couchioplanes caeruleus TaxID=56438 RepID=UPI00201C4BC4|nr:preprotein translocase subunit SecE [Couchioplanes caeruleus]UQU64186.1 preprotein translocase subunit SecE [Couchioplanes caeruleus]